MSRLFRLLRPRPDGAGFALPHPASETDSIPVEEVEQMLRTTIALGLTALLATAGRAFAEENKNAAAKLAGEYTIVEGQREGQRETSEQMEGKIVTITEDTITVIDKDKKETYVASYKLNSSKKPCTIMLTEKTGPNKGEMARGLIERDGDSVKLIYALPGGETPTSFDGTKTKQLMFVLKRDKK
jgi:uncharacterized protein (TIGR03067 family)